MRPAVLRVVLPCQLLFFLTTVLYPREQMSARAGHSLARARLCAPTVDLGGSACRSGRRVSSSTESSSKRPRDSPPSLPGHGLICTGKSSTVRHLRSLAVILDDGGGVGCSPGLAWLPVLPLTLCLTRTDVSQEPCSSEGSGL